MSQKTDKPTRPPLPAGGGSYRREPDGALRRQDASVERASARKPKTTETPARKGN